MGFMKKRAVIPKSCSPTGHYCYPGQTNAQKQNAPESC